jgi:hypothetical protein
LVDLLVGVPVNRHLEAPHVYVFVCVPASGNLRWHTPLMELDGKSLREAAAAGKVLGAVTQLEFDVGHKIARQAS